MEFKPLRGTRVVMANGKHGVVSGHPVKLKHQDKVSVLKDGESGCNAEVMVKYENLRYEIHPLLPPRMEGVC